MRYEQHKDPAGFGGHITNDVRAKSRIALGVDLGTNAGYSYTFFDPAKPYRIGENPVFLGQWDLSAGSYDSGAIRFVRFSHFLSAIKPDIVFFEDVKYTPSEAITKYNASALMARAATSAEFMGALKGTLAKWAEENDVPATSIPIGTIKKRATGKGNANKEDMIAAINSTLSLDLSAEDYKTTGVDNIADAFWCMICGLEEYGNGVPRLGPDHPVSTPAQARGDVQSARRGK